MSGGVSNGKDLSRALPGLIDGSEIAALAASSRADLLLYLRGQLANLDDCDDLILIDLGYSGSIQKSLRRVFDASDIKTRLHGLYLLTVDEVLDDLPDGDSAEGFISDLVVNPHAKRMLLRNVAPLEQICSSATGSVRGYRAGHVLLEHNPLPAEQVESGRKVQAGALAFARTAQLLAPAYRLDPFADLDIAARSAAAVLGRLLMLPTDDELLLLGSIKHDVNLGTHALAPLLDGGFASGLQVAQAFPTACAAPEPPMWLAGSFAALSPLHNFLYLQLGSGRLPHDIFGDVRCGELEIGLIGADGAYSLAPIGCFRTGFGELRL